MKRLPLVVKTFRSKKTASPFCGWRVMLVHFLTAGHIVELGKVHGQVKGAAKERSIDPYLLVACLWRKEHPTSWWVDKELNWRSGSCRHSKRVDRVKQGRWLEACSTLGDTHVSWTEGRGKAWIYGSGTDGGKRNGSGARGEYQHRQANEKRQSSGSDFHPIGSSEEQKKRGKNASGVLNGSQWYTSDICSYYHQPELLAFLFLDPPGSVGNERSARP